MERERGISWAESLRAAGITAGLIVLEILAFACCIHAFSLPSEIVRPVNQFLKSTGIFLGCVIALKQKNGAAKGALAGVLAAIFSNAVFAIAAKSLPTASALLFDGALFLVVGVFSGVVAVNVKREEK